MIFRPYWISPLALISELKAHKHSSQRTKRELEVPPNQYTQRTERANIPLRNKP